MGRSKPRTAESSVRKRGGLRHWKRYLLAAVILMGACLWFAPTLLATFLLSQILARLSAHVDGHLTAGQLSAGWFQPIVIRDLEGRDAGGETLLTVQELRIERTLVALLMDPGQVGLIRIHAPRVRGVVRADGSNLEDFLEPLLSGPSATTPLVVAWEVRDGEIELQCSDTAPGGRASTRWMVKSLQGKFERAELRALALNAELQLHDAASADGALHIDLRTSGLPLESMDPRHAKGELTVVSRQTPLAALQPVARRLGQSWILQGALDGKLQASLQQGRWIVDWHDVVASGGHLHLPELFENRPLSVDAWRSEGRLEWQNERWDVTTELTTNFGTARLQAESVAAGDVPPLLRWLAAGKVDVHAQVDLAQLAAAAPELLRLHQDVVIRSGIVKLNVSGVPREEGTHWTAAVDTSDLAATRGTTEIVWPEPVRGILAARWVKNQLVVDELVCRSEFLTASLEGSADDATLRFNGDLARLAERLRTLFDIPGQFRGRVDGEMHWKRRPPDVIAAARVVAHDIDIAVPAYGTWQKPAVVALLDATLRREAQPARMQLTNGSLQLTAGAERLAVRLDSPLDLQRPAAEILAEVAFSTPLKNSELRRRWLPVDERLDLAGQLDARAQFRWSPERLDLLACDGQVADLELRSAYCHVLEPRATFSLAGQWDASARRWTTARAEFATSTMAASGDDVRLALPDSGWELDGTLLLRADVGRLQRWLSGSSPATPAARWEWLGELVGRSQISLRPAAGELQWTANVNQFQMRQKPANQALPVATSAAQSVAEWSEPQTQLAGRLRWDKNDRLELSQLRLEGQSWRLQGDATINELQTNPQLQINGIAEYDWQQFHGYLRAAMGPGLTLTGKRQDRFTLGGPLSDLTSLLSPELRGSATTGWETASYEGVQLGRAEVPVEIREGIAYFGPVSIPFSEGTLSAAPQLDLRQSPLQVILPAGRVLDSVRISPEMCRGWLKYIAPPVADATQAEGRFSLQLAQAVIPLDNPQHAQAQGTLEIHGANIGASPVTQMVLTLVDRVAAISERRLPRLNNLATGAWVVLPEQAVEFEVRDGRVTHRQLRMEAQEVTVLTRGSVGLDQRLDLFAQMQFPANVLQKNDWLNNLNGKWIPVRGSLKNPELDEKVWQDLTRSLLGGAAERLLEDELRKGLDRLLRPRP
jgi:translocation and assembly module TamB